MNEVVPRAGIEAEAEEAGLTTGDLARVEAGLFALAQLDPVPDHMVRLYNFLVSEERHLRAFATLRRLRAMEPDSLQLRFVELHYLAAPPPPVVRDLSAARALLAEYPEMAKLDRARHEVLALILDVESAPNEDKAEVITHALEHSALTGRALTELEFIADWLADGKKIRLTPPQIRFAD